MNRFTGLILALVVGASVGACASTGTGGASAGDVGGIKPSENRYTRDANRAIGMAMLRQDEEEKREQYRIALENALLAIQENESNPRAWYLAGQAYANLGDIAGADSAFTRAETLYPPYVEELIPERETAWVMAYNEAVTAWQANDLAGAIRHMEAADRIYRGRPEARIQLGALYAQVDEVPKAISAYRGALEILRTAPRAQLDPELQAEWEQNEEVVIANLGQLLMMEGEYAEAEALYREVVANRPDDVRARVSLADALSRQDKTDEANEVYIELLGRGDLSFNDYIMIGVGMFQAGDYDRAVESFQKAIQQNPHSRDAYFNLAQSLYLQANKLDESYKAAQGAEQTALRERLVTAYSELAAAGDKVLEMDPFNRDIIAFQARAFQMLSELESNANARNEYLTKVQSAVRRHGEMPFELMDVGLTTTQSEVRVQGQFVNLKLQSGEAVRLRFTVVSPTGSTIGSSEVTISAPAVDASTRFQTTIPINGELGGWRYERVQ